MLEIGKNDGVTNAQYHGDRKFLSSSSLKMLLKNPADFYKRYILNEREEATNESALTFGTVAHTMILEPNLFDSEVAVYPGPMRRGAQWEAFKVEHAGKNIITASEADKLGALYEAYRKCEPATAMMEGVEVEATYCGNISDFPVKVRCDAINVSKGYILDVKTTSYPNKLDDFKQVVSQLYYGLSAALYCEVCEAYYGRPFDFYFMVLSKQDGSCKMYKASKETLKDGSKQIREAIEVYNRCMATGVWEHAKEDFLVESTGIEEV